jgi:hypothetical protein
MNSVLGRIFRSKKQKVMRKEELHNVEVHGFYSLVNVIKAIESMSERLVTHVVCNTKITNLYAVLVRNSQGKINLGNLVV